MILVDTGPLVSLFDPHDGQHDRCATALINRVRRGHRHQAIQIVF
jgi:predicted nucleic acid-binding protein